jgi:hypothetical protein
MLKILREGFPNQLNGPYKHTHSTDASSHNAFPYQFDCGKSKVTIE